MRPVARLVWSSLAIGVLAWFMVGCGPSESAATQAPPPPPTEEELAQLPTPAAQGAAGAHEHAERAAQRMNERYGRN